MALRLVALAIVDVFAVVLIYIFVHDGLWPLAAIITLTTVLINVVNLWDRFYPLRWMSGAFAIILLMVLYPIIFTVYTAFTNYSDGHLLTKVSPPAALGRIPTCQRAASSTTGPPTAPRMELCAVVVGCRRQRLCRLS